MLKTLTYWAEIVLAPVLALYLIASSSLPLDVIPGLVLGGAVAQTLAEYGVHRFVLHDLAPVQHRLHHAKPNDVISSIFWPIWAAFAVVYLIAGGAVLAGILLAYTWYLFVHHCAHHGRNALPASLLNHHDGHHRYATRNFSVSNVLWDHVFGTVLR